MAIRPFIESHTRIIPWSTLMPWGLERSLTISFLSKRERKLLSFFSPTRSLEVEKLIRYWIRAGSGPEGKKTAWGGGGCGLASGKASPPPPSNKMRKAVVDRLFMGPRK